MPSGGLFRPTSEEARRVFDTPSKALRVERDTVLGSPFWFFRWLLVLVVLGFVAKGAWDLLRGWGDDERRHWSIPFTNSRGLLLAHFCCAGPFLIAAISQKLLIGWDAGRRVHRLLGRFAVATGALAAISALLLSPGALAGTWVVFAPWSALWLLASVMTLLRARQRDWASHRAWANLLSQSAWVFMTGRLALTLCRALELPVEQSYYWSMLLAAVCVGVRFAIDSHVWHERLHVELLRQKLQTAARRAWIVGTLQRRQRRASTDE